MKKIILFIIILTSFCSLALGTTDSIVEILSSDEYRVLESDLRKIDVEGYRFQLISFRSSRGSNDGKGNKISERKFTIKFDHNFYINKSLKYTATLRLESVSGVDEEKSTITFEEQVE